MPKQFPAEFRQRALRLLGEARQQEQYETEWAAITAVGSRLGVNSATQPRPQLSEFELNGEHRNGGRFRPRFIDGPDLLTLDSPTSILMPRAAPFGA